MKNKKGTKALGHYGTKFTLAYLLQKICKDLKSHRKFQAARRNFGDLLSATLRGPSLSRNQRFRQTGALVPECLENCQFAHSVRKFGRVEDAQYNYKAFTLAEVLITLAIIGIVSALVIPSVLKNYNDKKYNTARLKALKTFGEAGKMASINGEMNGQPTAKDFVNNVLSKYLKITKVCDKAEECGFPVKFKASNSANTIYSNNLKSWKDIGAGESLNNLFDISGANFSIFLVTADGFSAKLFYNPKCAKSSKEITWDSCTNAEQCWSRAIDQACINFIYDMNEELNPNHVGEDIGFVTVFWSGLNTNAVAPSILPFNVAKDIFDEGKKNWNDAQKLCSDKGTLKTPYMLPNIDELQSITLNKNIASLPGGQFWSNSLTKPVRDNIVWIAFDGGSRYTYYASYSNNKAWCVRR